MRGRPNHVYEGAKPALLNAHALGSEKAEEEKELSKKVKALLESGSRIVLGPRKVRRIWISRRVEPGSSNTALV